MPFLGHLGTTELAYAALSGVYYLIFAAMGYGLSNAILSMISRQAGENNRLNIVNTLRHGYLLAAILAFVAIVLLFWLTQHYGQSGSVFARCPCGKWLYEHPNFWSNLSLWLSTFQFLFDLYPETKWLLFLLQSLRVLLISYLIIGLFLEAGA